MTRQTQTIVLAVLLVILAGTGFYFYRSYFPSEGASVPPPAALDVRFTPLNVDNPALRMDILKRFLALEYKGVHRSIFSAVLPPPPAPPVVAKAPVNVAPPVPAGPPPLTVDAKYFGYVSDFSGNHRRAFFATPNNEDVIIAGEGDTLLGRFRIVRLTNTTADVEEVSSGRRTTLTLEQPTPSG
jgi:hypothetical protein